MSPPRASVNERATQNDIGWALGELLRSYRDVVAPALSGFPQGPRGYQTVLEVLQGDRPTQQALANHLGIDRTVMTYLIDDLEQSGLVERRLNPDDRRQRQVVATDRGRKAVELVYDKVVEAECHVLGGLDPDEQQLFRTLLCKAASAAGDPAVDACLTVLDA